MGETFFICFFDPVLMRTELLDKFVFALVKKTIL